MLHLAPGPDHNKIDSAARVKSLEKRLLEAGDQRGRRGGGGLRGLQVLTSTTGVHICS